MAGRKKQTAQRGQGVKRIMKLSDLCLVACVRDDGTVQSADGREHWQDVDAWQRERIKRRLAGTLIYNFPAPDKD